MYTLMFSNIDCSSIAWEKWNTKPSKEELAKVFNDYYDQSMSNRLADELLRNKTVDLDDTDRTSFKLIKT